MSVSISCAFSWALFFSVSFCPILMFAAVLSYYITVYFLIIPYKSVCFLKRNRKAVDLDERSGEKLGGVVEQKTIIRIYYIKTYFQ